MRILAGLGVAVLLLSKLPLHAQEAYWVFFKDKGPQARNYLLHPQRMLADASLQRRAQQGIPVTLQDVPVHAAYLQALASLGPVKGASRWLNAAYAILGDSASLTAVIQLPFVHHILPVLPIKSSSTALMPAATTSQTTDGQLAMLNLPALQAKGYTGVGVRIAVLDGGFIGTNRDAGLAAARNHNQLLDSVDFVHGGRQVYGWATHGAQVLSCLVGYLPSLYQGAAPAASYLLAITEDVNHEVHQEELNWQRGAEWADSAGASIISSSLGYSQFDPGQGDYSYQDMNGYTSRVTQAAEAASQRGMLVVNAAGNEGNSPWRHITAPCDGVDVLCVGAVAYNKVLASFSSVGPTADGRIKPDVCAQGVNTATLLNSAVVYPNGTSFSTPLVAGLAACLWQAHPKATAQQLHQAIVQSADRATYPDNEYGYGIPDALQASNILANFTQWAITPELVVGPNPAKEKFILLVRAPNFEPVQVELYALNGQLVTNETISSNAATPFSTGHLATGLYLLRCKLQGTTLSQRILISQ